MRRQSTFYEQKLSIGFNLSSKTRNSEEPLLKLLRSAKIHRTNSSQISNCLRSKSAILFRTIGENHIIIAMLNT